MQAPEEPVQAFDTKSVEGTVERTERFEQPVPEIKRNKVFISYSHADRNFLEQLLLHLKPLRRDQLISTFSDEQISAGDLWLEEIKVNLASTRVAVMMVSASFLASDFIHKHELMPLLKEAAQGGVSVLWIPVRDCNHEASPLAKYQAVFDPKRTLARMRVPDRDKAYATVSKAITQVLGIYESTGGPPVTVL